MLWGMMKFMIQHDKEAQNEGETMAPACDIYEFSNTNDICFYAPLCLKFALQMG